ncbi:MAG: FkbM family methyltransferase [Lentisphaeraceae bacterium]|nr:FkbM family methyltransferase [Lentisphaeraceae bacterium]
MDLNKLTNGRYGQFLYNVHDKIIGRALEAYGEWAQDELDLLKHFIKPGDTVIDLGANIGTHSIAFANFVGTTGKVIAFEPQRIIYQCLSANIALNSLMNVWAHPYGVSDEPSLIRMPQVDYTSEQNFGSISLRETGNGEEVPIVRLDDFCQESCSLIKMDVEGMEIAALKGAERLINKYKPILYTENNNNDRSAELIKYIESLGYNIYWHLSPFFNAKNFKNKPENIFGNIMDINLLCSMNQVNGSSNCFFPATAEINTPELAFQKFQATLKT